MSAAISAAIAFFRSSVTASPFASAARVSTCRNKSACSAFSISSSCSPSPLVSSSSSFLAPCGPGQLKQISCWHSVQNHRSVLGLPNFLHWSQCHPVWTGRSHAAKQGSGELKPSECRADHTCRKGALHTSGFCAQTPTL